MNKTNKLSPSKIQTRYGFKRPGRISVSTSTNTTTNTDPTTQTTLNTTH